MMTMDVTGHDFVQYLSISISEIWIVKYSNPTIYLLFDINLPGPPEYEAGVPLTCCIDNLLCSSRQ
jgi:hypothetical protein